MERLPYSQMLSVKKEGKYSVITCVDGRQLRIRKPLQEVAAELDKQEFIQIDRGNIVNISMISQITSEDVVCKNGTKLQYSRAKCKEIKSKIALYWGKKI